MTFAFYSTYYFFYVRNFGCCSSSGLSLPWSWFQKKEARLRKGDIHSQDSYRPCRHQLCDGLFIHQLFLSRSGRDYAFIFIAPSQNHFNEVPLGTSAPPAHGFVPNTLFLGGGAGRSERDTFPRLPICFKM